MKLTERRLTSLFKLSSLSVFLLVNSLISSCAHKGHGTQQSITDILQKVCFSSEGRGQFRSETEVYRFSYESQFNKKNQWVAALDLPLHGTEVFALLPSVDRPKVGGSFGKRLMQSGAPSNQEKSQSKLFREFLKKFSFLLMTKKGIPLNDLPLEERDWTSSEISGGIELSNTWDKHKKFTMGLKDFNDEHYQQVELKVLDEDPAYIAPRYWAMTLLLERCKEKSSP